MPIEPDNSTDEQKLGEVRSGYVSAHWTRGGSGITNFQPEDLSLYQEAVKKFGDARIFISDKLMDGYGFTGKMSLHREDMKDMSDFWEVFWKLHRKSLVKKQNKSL